MEKNALNTFDVRGFLSDYGIPFKDHGKNCGKDHVIVKCPFCEDDPSEHMGIHEWEGWYGCWRDSSHRGRDFSYLAAKLIGIPQAKAKSLLVLYGGVVNDKPEEQPVTTVVLPDEFSPLEQLQSMKSLFPFYAPFDYLEHRGIDIALAIKLGIGVAFTGKYSNRIIIPVRRGGLLRGYTARTWTNDKLRYLSSQGFQEIWPYTDESNNTKKEYLVIHEGPFDALRSQTLFNKMGVDMTAMCLFGKTITDKKRNLLVSLSRQYKKLVVMLDGGCWATAEELKNDVGTFYDKACAVECPQKDPGVMREGDWESIMFP